MNEQLERKAKNENGDWQWFLQFAGIEQGHNYYVYHSISENIRRHPPKLILEIGTYKGAMSVVLGLEAVRLGIPCISVDISDQRDEGTKRLFQKLGIEFYELDIFEHRQKFFNVVKEYDSVYVVCDGGNKREEFLMFSKELKPGSMISVHDYSVEFLPEDAEPVNWILDPLDQHEWMNHNAQFATWIRKWPIE